MPFSLLLWSLCFISHLIGLKYLVLCSPLSGMESPKHGQLKRWGSRRMNVSLKIWFDATLVMNPCEASSFYSDNKWSQRRLWSDAFGSSLGHVGNTDLTLLAIWVVITSKYYFFSPTKVVTHLHWCYQVVWNCKSIVWLRKEQQIQCIPIF